MTRPLICDVGEALFGSRWQSELARALDISNRTMRRWVAEEYPVPPFVYAELLGLVTQRAEALLPLIPLLQRAAASAPEVPQT